MELRPRALRQHLIPESRKRRRDCSISPHLLWLVFLRLPLKSLFRCKAVCKVFDSVVSDPVFAADYRRRSPRTPSGEPACAGIFFTLKAYPRNTLDYRVLFIPGSGNEDGPGEYDPSYTFYPRRSSHRRSRSRFGVPPYYKNVILVSSGGILLCSGEEFVPESNESRSRLYVVNPLTKEWRALPLSPEQRNSAVIGFVCHEGVQLETGACDYDYEVVRISNGGRFYREGTPVDTITNIIETYSSRSHEWSVVSIPSQIFWNPYRECMTAVGGIFYWRYREKLITYNPATCKIEELPLPVAGDTRLLSIGEGADGSLTLYVSDNDGFDVWQRVSDKQRLHPPWIKRRVEWVEMVPQSPSTHAEYLFMSARIWYVKAFPGDPRKVLLEGISEVLTYELRSEKLELLYRGEHFYVMHECCCYSYHLPSWHFRL